MFLLGFLAGINTGFVIKSLAELIGVCIERRQEKRAENERILKEIRDAVLAASKKETIGADTDGDKAEKNKKIFFGGLEDIVHANYDSETTTQKK